MGKYRKLGKNFIIISIGSFASRLISFFLVPLYTSVLSTAQYGEIDLITTTSNLVLPFVSLCLYDALVRFALENKEEDRLKQLLSISLYVDLIGCSALAIISIFVLRITPLSGCIDLFIIYTLVLSLSQITNQFVRGKECMLDYAVAGVMHTFIFVLSNILFLLVFKLGVRGYLWAHIIGYIVPIVFLNFRCRIYKYLIKPKEIKREQVRLMLAFSLPLIPNAISWWVSNSSDKYIITAFCGVAENGIYSVAYKIPTILTVFTSLFYSAWQISSIEGFGTEETRFFYEDVRNKYSTVIIIIASAVIAMTKPIAGFMYQKEFQQAWLFTPVLILASGCSAIANFYGSIFSAASTTKIIFSSTVIAALINIIINIALIPFWGGMGAAIATLVSYIVLLFIRFYFSKKILTMNINWGRLITSYALLTIETIIVSLDINWFLIPGIIIFILLVLINRKTFLWMADMLLQRIAELRRKKNA